MITWGSTTLSIAAGTWSPSRLKSSIEEIQLLPDPAAPTAVCTVLQQNGRLRKRIKGKLILTSMTAYNTLQADEIAGTSRTLADGYTVNASYIIEDLGDPADNSAGTIFADVTFVEV